MKPEELKGLHCQECGDDASCDGIVLCGQCCKGAPVVVTYRKDTHSLRLDCSRCGKEVVTLQFDEPRKKRAWDRALGGPSR